MPIDFDFLYKDKDEAKKTGTDPKDPLPCATTKVTIAGTKLGDTKTVVIGPDGKTIRIVEGRI